MVPVRGVENVLARRLLRLDHADDVLRFERADRVAEAGRGGEAQWYRLEPLGLGRRRQLRKVLTGGAENLFGDRLLDPAIDQRLARPPVVPTGVDLWSGPAALDHVPAVG